VHSDPAAWPRPGDLFGNSHDRRFLAVVGKRDERDGSACAQFGGHVVLAAAQFTLLDAVSRRQATSQYRVAVALEVEAVVIEGSQLRHC
jgi:hypothetical protein